MFQPKPTTDQPKKSRRLLPLLSGILIVAVLAGALVFSLNARNGAPAHAASASASASLTTTAAATRTFRARKAAQAGGMIICSVWFALAHRTNSFVEGLARVECSADVSGITMSILIYRDGKLARWGGKVADETDAAAGSATQRCRAPYHSHHWQAYLVGGIAFPSGYLPASAAINWGTPVFTLSC